MQQEFLSPAPLYPRDNSNQRKIMPLKDFEAKKKEINELLNSKAKELKELGLLDKLGEFVGIQTDNAKQRESQLNEIKEVALKRKTDFKDLPSALKDEILQQSRNEYFKPV